MFVSEVLFEISIYKLNLKVTLAYHNFQLTIFKSFSINIKLNIYILPKAITFMFTKSNFCLLRYSLMKCILINLFVMFVNFDHIFIFLDYCSKLNQ